jgi:predicted nucleic-acid-binding Zn-ribbon protein
MEGFAVKTWKCPECGFDNLEEARICQCGYALPYSSEKNENYKFYRFGNGLKGTLVLLLASIVNTTIIFKYRNFSLNNETVPFYIGSGIGEILSAFLIFLIPGILFNYFSVKHKTSYSKVWLNVSYFTAVVSLIFIIGHISSYKKESEGRVANDISSEKIEKINDDNFPVTAAVTRQDSQGMTEARLDQAALKDIEKWLVQTIIQKSKSDYASSGNDASTFKPRVEAKSVYVNVRDKKLGVIKINFNDSVRAVNIIGFQNKEFIRVSCWRNSNDDIPVFSGACGDKVKEAFGVTLP